MEKHRSSARACLIAMLVAGQAWAGDRSANGIPAALLGPYAAFDAGQPLAEDRSTNAIPTALLEPYAAFGGGRTLAADSGTNADGTVSPLGVAGTSGLASAMAAHGVQPIEEDLIVGSTRRKEQSAGGSLAK